jgi:hypothetical protein
MSTEPHGNEESEDGNKPDRGLWTGFKTLTFWVPAIFYATLIFLLSSLEGRTGSGGGRFDFLPLHDIYLMDKFYHIALYGFLGAALLAGFLLSVRNCVPRVMDLVEKVHGRVLATGKRGVYGGVQGRVLGTRIVRAPERMNGAPGIFSLDLSIYILVMIFGIAYGISDEIHQTFVPDRTASIADVLADAAGLFLACLLHHLLRRYGGSGGVSDGRA